MRENLRGLRENLKHKIWSLATAQSSLGVPVSVPQQGGNSGQQFVSYNGDTYLIQTGKVLQLVGWT